MNHLVLGSSIPFFLAMVLYFSQERRAGIIWLLLTPLFMALGAIYAFVPDIPRLLGNRALYDQLAKNPHMDIFLWHHTIDQTESDTPLWGLVFIIMAATLLWVAWRELNKVEDGG